MKIILSEICSNNLAAPPLSTLHKVSSLASGSLLLASRSLVGQGTQAYSINNDSA
jgi:hypothetical protein